MNPQSYRRRVRAVTCPFNVASAVTLRDGFAYFERKGLAVIAKRMSKESWIIPMLFHIYHTSVNQAMARWILCYFEQLNGLKMADCFSKKEVKNDVKKEVKQILSNLDDNQWRAMMVAMSANAEAFNDLLCGFCLYIMWNPKSYSMRMIEQCQVEVKEAVKEAQELDAARNLNNARTLQKPDNLLITLPEPKRGSFQLLSPELIAKIFSFGTFKENLQRATLCRLAYRCALIPAQVPTVDLLPYDEDLIVNMIQFMVNVEFLYVYMKQLVHSLLGYEFKCSNIRYFQCNGELWRDGMYHEGECSIIGSTETKRFVPFEAATGVDLRRFIFEGNCLEEVLCSFKKIESLVLDTVTCQDKTEWIVPDKSRWPDLQHLWVLNMDPFEDRIRCGLLQECHASLSNVNLDAENLLEFWPNPDKLYNSDYFGKLNELFLNCPSLEALELFLKTSPNLSYITLSAFHFTMSPDEIRMAMQMLSEHPSLDYILLEEYEVERDNARKIQVLFEGLTSVKKVREKPLILSIQFAAVCCEGLIKLLQIQTALFAKQAIRSYKEYHIQIRCRCEQGSEQDVTRVIAEWQERERIQFPQNCVATLTTDDFPNCFEVALCSK
jgi:hypothetical protein